MDGYERTTELMKTAADATGKADQQFNKYADTIEYRMKELKTQWETLRVHIAGSDFFKGAIDSLNNVLNRVSKKETKELGITLLSGIFGVTTFIKILSQTITTAIPQITPKITEKLAEISPLKKFEIKATFNSEVAEARVKELENEFNNLEQSIKEANIALQKLEREKANALAANEGSAARERAGKYQLQAYFNWDKGTNSRPVIEEYLASTGVATNNTRELKKAVQELATELGVKLNDKTIICKGNFDLLAAALNDVQRETDEANAAEKRHAEDIASTYNTQIDNTTNKLAALNAQLEANSQTQDKVKAKIPNAESQLKGLSTALSSVASSAIFMGASIASGAMEADTALTSMTTMLTVQFVSMFFQAGTMAGMSFTEGLAASGVGLWVAAIAAALSGVGILIAKLVKSQRLNNFENRLNQIAKDIEEAEERLQTLESEAKEAKTEEEEVKRIAERYQELNNKIVLTEDEQKEYNELIKEIREKEFPGLVTYYDEITNELQVQNDLWDDIIEKTKEQRNIAYGKSYAQNAGLMTEKTSQNELKQKAANDVLDVIKKYTSNDVSSQSKVAMEYYGAFDELLSIYGLSYNSKVASTKSALPEEIAKALNLDNAAPGADYADQFKYLNEEQKEILTDYLNKYIEDLKTDLEKTRKEQETEALEIISSNLNVGEIAAIAINNNIPEDIDAMQFNSRKASYLNNYLGVDAETLGGFTLEEYLKSLFNISLNSKGKVSRDLTDDELTALNATIKANQAYMNEVSSIEDDLLEKLQEFDGKWKDLNDVELEKYYKNLGKYGSEAREQVKEKNEEIRKDLQKYGLGNLIGFNTTYSDLETIKVRFNAVNARMGTNEQGTQKTTQYFKGLLSGLNDKEKGIMTSFDPLSLDPSNYVKSKEKIIQALIEGGTSPEKAGRIWAEKLALGFEYGLLDNLAPAASAGVDAMREGMEENIDKLSNDFSGITNALENFRKKGFLTPSQLKAVKEKLTDVGLDPREYIDFASNSLKDADALVQAFKDLGAQEVENIEGAIQIETDRIALLEKELALGNDVGEELDSRRQALLDLNVLLDDARGYANSLYKGIDTMNEEATPDETDAEKATKAYETALKNLEKAQEDVAKAQETLNEKIKDYNDLLNGTANKESSLDALYNYDQALSSFNDEITRSKEIMEDAKTVDKALEALNRYGEATKNVIAEEKAKQEVIKQGLKNYGDVIENGSYSYTNAQTGQTTNINFGDYARKDARTGQYMIDQRLLTEARFADTFKDLLEKQVSEYNKYAEELLKSEDNVRKAEKTITDEREEALKKYVALETELAEALKKQYEDEVKDVKDKYDAMKAEDDDYLKALKDALEKQKKLREQENKWEDLARQEKKLALMRRDTSGANAKDVASLERDVEKTRDDMLNDAIDNVVDNLEKLYEAQEKLYDEEVELKEAIVDNTAFWNAKAAEMIQGFDNAEEYAQYITSISKEYADMTLAMQQEKLLEYSHTYEEATEYMALQAMDAATETGDFIVDMTMVTGQEVTDIVNQTAEAFTSEVIRQLNATTDAFTEDMKKAAQAIADANKALQEAYEKLADCAKAANEAADAMNKETGGGGGVTNGGNPIDNWSEEVKYNKTETQQDLYGVGWSALDWMNNAIKNKRGETFVRKAFKNAIALSGNNWNSFWNTFVNQLSEEDKTKNLPDVMKAIGLSSNSIDYPDIIKGRAKQFATGGIVNYTGPAWVDGTYSKPEAFLSAEDTARIGEAAKILADLPWLNKDGISQNITNNRGGDVSVEINLNVDKLSSDVDVDSMLERMKQEIVTVARPIGSPTILTQS